MDKLLTVDEVAAVFRVTNQTIWNWVDAKKLRVVRVNGRCVRFLAIDVATFIDAMRGVVDVCEKND